MEKKDELSKILKSEGYYEIREIEGVGIGKSKEKNANNSVVKDIKYNVLGDSLCLD